MAASRVLKDSEFLIDSWDTDSGLPEMSATSMVQTKDRQLWFGSFNGLVRFDGARFTVHDQVNTPALPNPGIVELHLDKKDRLWVSTMGGLAMLDGTRWSTFRKDQGWPEETYVRTWAEGNPGQLVVSTFDNRVLRLGAERWEQMPQPPGTPGRGYRVHFDRTGRLWSINPDVIAEWRQDHWQTLDGARPATRLPNYGTGPARNGGVWILNDRTLRLFLDGKLTDVATYDMEAVNLWSIYEARDGTLWGNSYISGLYRLTRDGSIRRYTENEGLSFNVLRFTFEDHEGNLWVGTSGGGLMRLKERAFNAVGVAEGLQNRIVSSTAFLPDGRVLIGSFGGSIVAWEDGRASRFPVPGFTNSYVNSLLVDHTGSLWIGSHIGSLFRSRLDGSPGTWLHPERLEPGDVNALFQDQAGRVWVGWSEGVAVHETEQLRFLGAEQGVISRQFCSFAQAPGNGPVWAGTRSDGLYRFDGESVRRFGPVEGLPDRACLALTVDREGRLWIGTGAAGLVLYEGGRFMSVDERHGLPARSILGLLEGEQEELWLTSNHGVIRASREELAEVASGQRRRLNYRLFDAGDGLPGNDCRGGQQGITRGKDGRLWVSTIRGAAWLNPRTVPSFSEPLAVRMHSIAYSRDEPERSDSRTEGGAMVQILDPIGQFTVPPSTRRVELRFSALSFAAPEKVRCEYQLQGVDPQWVSAGSGRQAVYERLPPGRYLFRARACDSFGGWNETGASIALIVQPAFWQTGWFRLLSLIAIATAGGGLTWVITTIRNRERTLALKNELALLAERDKAFSRLRESEQRFRILIDSIQDVVFNLAPDFTIVSLSPSFLTITRHPPEAWIGKSFLDLVVEEDRPRIRAVLEDVLGLQQSAPFEVRIVSLDGRPVTIELTLTAQRHGREIAGLVAVGRDTTERQNAALKQASLEVQLQRALKMESLGVMAGGVAHDFNNILGAIYGAAAMLRLDIPANDPALDSVKIIEDAGRRGRDIVREIMAFSRSQTLETVPIDLNQVVPESLRMLSALVLKDIHVSFFPRPGLPKILADRSQIVRVLMNIFMNARDAMPNGGRIEIALDCTHLAENEVHALTAGDYVELKISDTGSGMDTATLQRIFEPFFSTKPASQGTGLGLAVVYGIIQQHHGAIQASSTPNMGTTFRILLPALSVTQAASASTAISESQTPLAPIATAPANTTILVVDDEPSLRETTGKILSHQGYQVYLAKDGVEALEIFEARMHTLDLVVMDVLMPNMGGTQAAEAMRSLRPGIPILFMSGYMGSPAGAPGQRKPPAGPLLNKPFTARDLMAAVTATLRLRTPPPGSSTP